MILNLITLSNVKAQLGITTNVYDTAFNSLIPIVSNDIRRILNCSYDDYVPSTFSSGSASLLIGDADYYTMTTRKPKYDLGTVIYSPYIPTDTYLSSYDPSTGYYTMSANATATGDYIIPSISISMWPTIAKMIWYKYSKQNTTDSIARGIHSESYGPVSITYSAKEINRQYDYPQVLIDDLGGSFCKVG